MNTLIDPRYGMFPGKINLHCPVPLPLKGFFYLETDNKVVETKLTRNFSAKRLLYQHQQFFE